MGMSGSITIEIKTKFNLKEHLLEACTAIDARERNKLGGESGLCWAIYKFIREVGQCETNEKNFDSILLNQICDLCDYLAVSLFKSFPHSPYISSPGRWTPRREKLLKDLIEVTRSDNFYTILEEARKKRYEL